MDDTALTGTLHPLALRLPTLLWVQGLTYGSAREPPSHLTAAAKLCSERQITDANNRSNSKMIFVPFRINNLRSYNAARTWPRGHRTTICGLLHSEQTPLSMNLMSDTLLSLSVPGMLWCSLTHSIEERADTVRDEGSPAMITLLSSGAPS